MKAIKPWANRPRSIRFHQQDDKRLDQESFQTGIPVSVLVRSFVRECLEKRKFNGGPKAKLHGAKADN